MSEQIMDNRLVYTIPETATLLGISRNLAYELAQIGQIPAIKISKGRYIVPKIRLQGLLDGCVANFEDSVALGRTIPSRLKWAVWQRDNFTCRKCGVQEFLEVDHIIPFSKGGATVLDNLQTLCHACNQDKGRK